MRRQAFHETESVSYIQPDLRIGRQSAVKVLIKLAATWEGIAAMAELEKEAWIQHVLVHVILQRDMISPGQGHHLQHDSGFWFCSCLSNGKNKAHGIYFNSE